MDASNVRATLGRRGEDVTLRRWSGSPRVAHDVVCRAVVSRGAASVLVGGVTQTADRIILTNAEAIVAGWPLPPRYGDFVIYASGKTTAIQGDPETHHMGSDTVYVLRTLGA